jgi:hypothetical protein
VHCACCGEFVQLFGDKTELFSCCFYVAAAQGRIQTLDLRLYLALASVIDYSFFGVLPDSLFS